MTDRRRRLLVAVAVLLVVVVGGAAWLFGRVRTVGSAPLPGPTSPTAEGPSRTSAAPSAEPTPVPTLDEPGAPATAAPTATLGPTAAPVPLDETADFGAGLSGRLVEVERVEAAAEGPGEVAGPALRLTLELVNEGTADIPLDGVVVDLAHGEDRAPGEPMTGEGARDFAGTLRPGGTTTAVYVFAVPDDDPARVLVRVTHDPRERSVQFSGRVR